MRPSLREAFNLHIGRFSRKPAGLAEICGLFNRLVDSHRGVAVTEEWHGNYAFPLFLKESIPALAGRGVKRLYVEFIPAAKQGEIDRWQHEGEPYAAVDWLNTQHNGYSKRMWQHYWVLMQEAKEHGIRIVGVDNPEIVSGYGAVFDAPFKTMHWEGVITREQAKAAPGEKFVVFGGELHATDLGGALKGIHQHLDIPRLLLRPGPHSLARLPFDRRESYLVGLPKVTHQDDLSRQPDVRNVLVNTPL